MQDAHHNSETHALPTSELAALLAGSLPISWGAPGAFPALQYMGLAGTDLTGSLPGSWAAPGEAPFAVHTTSTSSTMPWGFFSSFSLSTFVNSLFLHLVIATGQEVSVRMAWLHFLFSLLTFHTLSS